MATRLRYATVRIEFWHELALLRNQWKTIRQEALALTQAQWCINA